MEKINIYKITGLPFAIFLVFISMKLAGAVVWSWWIVTLPLWFSGVALIALALTICIIILFGFIMAFACMGIYYTFKWVISLFKK